MAVNSIFEDMTKIWTGKDVRELTELAKRKGYNKGLLAELIGIHRSMLSRWIAAEDEELSVTFSNALSWIEYKINQREDLL